jgi:hypothetical protein
LDARHARIGEEVTDMAVNAVQLVLILHSRYPIG